MLPLGKQGVVDGQVHGRNPDFRAPREFPLRLEEGLEGRRSDRVFFRQQEPQSVIDPLLRLPRCQQQEPQILAICLGGSALAQGIVGGAEAAGGEQVLPVAILWEGSPFSDQPVDHVPVVDAVLVLAPDPGQALDTSLGIPDFQVLDLYPHFHRLSDQAARDRVGIV